MAAMSAASVCAATRDDGSAIGSESFDEVLQQRVLLGLGDGAQIEGGGHARSYSEMERWIALMFGVLDAPALGSIFHIGIALSRTRRRLRKIPTGAPKMLVIR